MALSGGTRTRRALCRVWRSSCNVVVHSAHAGRSGSAWRRLLLRLRTTRLPRSVGAQRRTAATVRRRTARLLHNSLAAVRGRATHSRGQPRARDAPVRALLLLPTTAL